MTERSPADWPVIPRTTPFEEHVVGHTFEHHWGRTIYASDNVSFSTQTMAFNPLYFNVDRAVADGRPSEVVNPMLVFSTVFGLSVEDLSEGGGPFLGASDVHFLREVHPGETLYAASTVVDTRESESRPGAGIVTWRTVGRVASGEPVIEFQRTNLVNKRVAGIELAPVLEGFAEDFRIGERFRHYRSKTITDLDLNGLTLSVMNTASGHFSEREMADTPFGERINFGGLTLSLTIGLATQDTTGQVIRELGLDDITFASPVRHGDTIGAATEVLAVTPHGDEADVVFRHFGFNQHDEVVCQANRTVRVRSRTSQMSINDESLQSVPVRK